jgi:hypothetical protein
MMKSHSPDYKIEVYSGKEGSKGFEYGIEIHDKAHGSEYIGSIHNSGH